MSTDAGGREKTRVLRFRLTMASRQGRHGFPHLISTILHAFFIAKAPALNQLSSSVTVFHTVQKQEAKVIFDVCISQLQHIHLFRGLHTLISVQESDDHQTWCSLSTVAMAHNHVCPWNCELPLWLWYNQTEPKQKVLDIAIQFVKSSTGQVSINYFGGSYRRSFSETIVQRHQRPYQLVTSFVVSDGESSKEHPLIVYAEETAKDAAARFVERHKIGEDYVPPLTSQLQNSINQRTERRRILTQSFSNVKNRVVIGASEAEISSPAKFGHSSEWLLLSVNDLDATSQDDWKLLFSSGGRLKAGLEVILAEHVFEHLDWFDALSAAKNAFDFLRPGGVLRLAVPDCFAPGSFLDNSRKEDIEYHHRIRFTLRSLTHLLVQAGFSADDITPIEYHSAAGFSYRRRFDPREGFIRRSFAFDKRGAVSLIVDAMKACPNAPISCEAATKKFRLDSRFGPAALGLAVQEIIRGDLDMPIPVATRVLGIDPTHPVALRVVSSHKGEPAWLHLAEAVETATVGRAPHP